MRDDARRAEDDVVPAEDGGRASRSRAGRVAGRLTLLVAAVVGIVAASSGATVELLVVRGEADTMVVDAITGVLTASVAGGVPSPDGSVIVAARRDGAETVLIAVDARDGARRWTRTIAGDHAVRLVAGDGETVVLDGSADTAGLYLPVPRVRTEITVSRADGTASTYDLAGNLEPEALSLDGRSLFVISYVPPMAPQRYQVRRLDLSSGEIVEVFTPDEELQQEMGGQARTQLWSPDGTRLYTLYTLGEGQQARAFVHVLALDGLWAHCIDLPAGVAAEDQSATALAASRDGATLYVADLAAGLVAEVDTERLQASPAVPVDRAAPPAGPVAAAVADDGRLILAADAQVRVLSAGGLVQEASWTVPGPVAGVHTSRGRDEVLVVLADRRILVAETMSGQPVRSVTVPGTGTIDSVGSAATRIDRSRDVLKCAC